MNYGFFLDGQLVGQINAEDRETAIKEYQGSGVYDAVYPLIDMNRGRISSKKERCPTLDSFKTK
ncbi:hypothetical protein [Algicola sagamiensis]|uniref:hypothetical protein n=1 Tax=Algicola sagamiensis TaxID=163869 RepID=UPI0003647A3F|nr:hypothetical protein [Algicola sagamiensis]